MTANSNRPVSYTHLDVYKRQVLLGDDLPEYAMPGLCIMSKRYLAGGGATGAIGIVGPSRMPYREMIPRLEYFALLLGECMSGAAGRQRPAE